MIDTTRAFAVARNVNHARFYLRCWPEARTTTTPFPQHGLCQPLVVTQVKRSCKVRVRPSGPSLGVEMHTRKREAPCVTTGVLPSATLAVTMSPSTMSFQFTLSVTLLSCPQHHHPHLGRRTPRLQTPKTRKVSLGRRHAS